MPSLHCAGRRWGVAGDEIFPAFACSVVTRAIWCAAIVVLLVSLEGNLVHCSYGFAINVWLLSSMALLALTAAVEAGIAAVSRRGSMTNSAPRRTLGSYLMIRFALAVGQLALAVVGTILLVTRVETVCAGTPEEDMTDVLLAIMAAAQYADVGLALCCCCTAAGVAQVEEEALPLFADRHDDELFPVEASRRRQWAERWRRCCGAASCLTCGLFGGSDAEAADFEHIARVMDRLFHIQYFFDLVPSDIAAGIVLLRHVQKAKERELQGRQRSLAAANSTAGTTISPQRTPRRSIAAIAAATADVAAARAKKEEGPSLSQSLDESSTSPTGRRVRRSAGGGGSMSGGSASGGGALGGGGAYFNQDGGAAAAAMAEPAGISLSSCQRQGGGERWERAADDGDWIVRRSREHESWHRVGRKRVVDVRDVADKAALEEVYYFAQYALAIYTWYLYVFDHLCSCRACELCLVGGCNRKFHQRRRRQFMEQSSDGGSDGGNDAEPQVFVLGDNFLASNEAALLRVAGLHPTCEVVFASFGQDALDETPYAIIVDHKTKSVVVTVRGTMSNLDVIIDALAETASMAESGRRWGFDGTDMWAHAGTLRRAEWVRRNIEQHGILRALMQNDGDGAAASTAPGLDVATRVRLGRYTAGGSYQLRTIGHSLGAGIAVLLGYMLNDKGGGGSGAAGGGVGAGNDAVVVAAAAGLGGGGGASADGAAAAGGGNIAAADGAVVAAAAGSSTGGGASSSGCAAAGYGAVRCLALSPLGGVLDAAHAMRCGDWVLAAVLGNDLVPRLGVDRLESVRDQVLDLIGRAKVNKMTVMRSAIEPGPPCEPSNFLRAAEAAPPDTRYQAQLARYREWAAQQEQKRDEPVLLPPGRIIHFIKTHWAKGWPRGTPIYTPVWTPNDAIHEILISTTMWTDHFPTNSIPAMERTLREMLEEADATSSVVREEAD